MRRIRRRRSSSRSESLSSRSESCNADSERASSSACMLFVDRFQTAALLDEFLCHSWSPVLITLHYTDLMIRAASSAGGLPSLTASRIVPRTSCVSEIC